MVQKEVEVRKEVRKEVCICMYKVGKKGSQTESGISTSDEPVDFMTISQSWAKPSQMNADKPFLTRATLLLLGLASLGEFSSFLSFQKDKSVNWLILLILAVICGICFGAWLYARKAELLVASWLLIITLLIGNTTLFILGADASFPETLSVFTLGAILAMLTLGMRVAYGVVLWGNLATIVLWMTNGIFIAKNGRPTASRVGFDDLLLLIVVQLLTIWLVSYLVKKLVQANEITISQASQLSLSLADLSHKTGELEKAQVQLIESEERYRALSQASFEGIMLHEQGIIVVANQVLADMLGYSICDLVGKAFNEFIQLETGVDHETTPDKKVSRYSESLALRRDGTYFPIESQTRNFDYQDREVKVSAIRDITVRKQTEEALLQSQEQLLQAQRSETIGRLTGGVAHDFNNLLTVILSYSELLISHPAPDLETIQEEVGQIKEAGLRAASLTQQLLAFSRQQVLQPRIINLNQIMGHMDKLLRRLIGEDIELQTVLDPALGEVKIDPGQFEQVVMNLAVNARDAMPKGGLLILETANIFLDREYVLKQHNLDIKTGEYVMLAVSDNGTGIDSAIQDRIFEPFFTTKEPGRGTGLGLATICGIVQQSGGYIWVYSTPDVGTTFKVFLPRLREGLTQSTEISQEGESSLTATSLGGSETILVVEDEEPVRTLLQQVFETYGYKVLIAKQGFEALAILESYSEPIDLILTDLIMPRMGGVELLEELRKQNRQTKLVGMSGYTDRVVVQQGILTLCDSYVQKPFTPNSLLLVIRKVLNQVVDIKV